MSILFIADVHLSHKKPKITKGFLHFLNHYAIKSEALYILGDLFEIWVGDDDQSLLHYNIAQSLKLLNKKKIPCYFIHGNHDFLLGSKYADLCGMILLPEKQVLQLPSGKNVLILHGDILCIHDSPYQLLQKILRHYVFKKLFLSLPLSIRLYIFNIARAYCIKSKQYKQKNKFSIDSQTIIDFLIQNQSVIMIHGHTHQAAIYNIHHSKTVIFKRIVLGYWDHYGSAVEINEKNDNLTLIKFPLYVE